MVAVCVPVLAISIQATSILATLIQATSIQATSILSTSIMFLGNRQGVASYLVEQQQDRQEAPG